MISICIPSWNSLEYLKILIPSIHKNTKVPFEIIVHENFCGDDTTTFLREECKKTDYTFSEFNEGFCAVNNCLKRARYPYCMIVNTDMYMLPGWDFAILNQMQQFKKQGIDRFTISSCLIEPGGNNPEYDQVYTCGNDAHSFNEQQLLSWYSIMKPTRQNTIQYSHPILIPKFMLEEVNYLDESYFPGWSVDHDLPKSLYEKGCRNFIMLGNSRVFHFSSKTFTKLPSDVKNRDGQDVFLKKWGMTVQQFRNQLEIATPFKAVK